MDASVTPPRRTPLFDRHVALGARMAPFGGFEMPIQYAGILQEHESTRRAVALFDTCHMGEFEIEGPTAAADLDRLVSCAVAPLAIGQCRYGYLCNPAGGVLDDLLVYRLAPERFMLVVNAGTQDADWDWVRAHLSPDTRATNRSADTGKLDIQGPGSFALLAPLIAPALEALGYYRFQEGRFDGDAVLVSRTGYTGERGFEVYAPPAVIVRLWDACLARGAVPAGLGARDTLRLEMGMPLYGHELGPDRLAAEAGFAAALAPDKGFIGAEAQRDPARPRDRLIGIVFPDRRAARAGDPVEDAAGAPIGIVTSGSFAPSLGRAIALAYVRAPLAVPDTPARVRTARAVLEGRFQRPPFHRGASARWPLTAAGPPPAP